MSNKKNNRPEYNETVETHEEESVEVTEEVVEEVVEESAVEDNVTEEVIEETIEEVVEEPSPIEVPAPEPKVEDDKKDSIPVPAEIKENVNVEVREEADPNPEVEGSYYIAVGRPLNDKELENIKEKISKAMQQYTITATGEVLVGPYETEDKALEGRIKLFMKGLRGEIIKL